MKTYKSLMQHLNKESKCKLRYSDMDLSDIKEKIKANSQEKSRERMKVYYQNNRDEILKQRQLYQKENGKKIAENKRNYYHKNTSKVKEQKSDYYQRNIKKITEKRNIKKRQTFQDEKEICKLCGKFFSQARDLNTHIHAIHRGPSRTKKSIDSTIKVSEENKEPEHDTVHEGPSLIRKKKPIDFTMEDLENDKEEEGDLDFKLTNITKNNHY